MVNFKQMGVAAAMALTAFSAMASNFRGADQVYVPAAGHVAGATGTFISDVWLSNLSTDPVQVSVIYQGQDGTHVEKNNLITLAAGERREFVDFFVLPESQGGLGLASGFGQLIFNGCKSSGSSANLCGADTQDAQGISPNYRDISVETRIYSIPPGTTLASNPPTTGQAFPGFPWYSFVTQDQSANGLDKIFITGLRNNGNPGQAGTYRGNIGLVNASQWSTTTMVVKLFNGATGQQIGSTFTRDLGPLAMAQINVGTMFPSFTGSTATNAYVTVEQTNSRPTTDPSNPVPSTCLPNGCPAFFAYGSILDNASGDATTLEAQYTRALSPTAIAAIYPSGAGKATIRRAAKH